ncbi:pyrroline-5-carboxylate reductase [Sphingomonas solaris]|uniref:Pyrroline-5-carboxylate reductase n=1 Tax=Alterirhizorhabdus solaris TaxID=2529389 RepID=A0A558RBN8_9SPHN|nr:pyrroline-5-carboxylate reductase [Sphingomonas solaris]TVV76867.1 pyrroline-5-carboxylate reductase [Sphingomonas solaris]
MATDGPLWLIGAGNMGGAMLRGWIGAGRDPATIVVIDPAVQGLPDGVTVLAAPPPDGAVPAVVVLAVKPQLLDSVAPGLAPMLAAETTLVSILAGVEIASLRRRFPRPAGVVRAMPNLPAAIGRGVTALYGERLDTGGRTLAETLVAPLGLVEWIDREDLFDAVTALSGCGPAFLFRFVEAMADAGAALGLPADQAARLALATVEGSAIMAAAAGEPAAVLADRVASPGGSTREGMNVLDAGDTLKALLRATLAASAARNAELAAAARG